MHKERERLDKQTPIQEAIRTLEVRNSAEGGMLLAIFGIGKSRALIFPTPAIEVKEKIGTERFLVVTRDGYKAIRVDHLGIDSANMDTDGISISRIVKNRLGKKQDSYWDFSPSDSEYKNNELILHRLLKITSEGTSRRSLGDPPQIYINCRLVDASDSQVEEILNLNIKRVEAIRATSKKVSEILDKTN